MTETSLGNASYFVTFLDDHSNKVWVSLLRSKDEVLEAFKEFLARMEQETGQKLKCIRANNDEEYCAPFKEYCKLHRIRLEKMPPKTP